MPSRASAWPVSGYDSNHRSIAKLARSSTHMVNPVIAFHINMRKGLDYQLFPAQSAQ